MATSPPITSKAWTDQELMALPDDGNKYELVNGELVMGNQKFQPDRLLSSVDILSGEEILPEFTFPVADLFPHFDV